MNIIKQIIKKSLNPFIRKNAKELLAHDQLIKLIMEFYNRLFFFKIVKGKIQAAEEKLSEIIFFSFTSIDKEIYAITDLALRSRLSDTAAQLMCSIYKMFLEKYGAEIHRPVSRIVSNYDRLLQPGSIGFVRQLINGIYEKAPIALQHKTVIFCNNYYAWNKNMLAKFVLMELCENRNLLKCRGSFVMVFGRHYCNLKLQWNFNRINELVILFAMLKENGYITIHGNKGFWSALQKHLHDFDGNVINISLYDLYCRIYKNVNAHATEIENVRKIFNKMLELAKEKGKSGGGDW